MLLFSRWRVCDHPVCAASEASRHSLDGAAIPPLEEGSFRNDTFETRQPYPTNRICRSIKFVWVGPVTMRSPVAFRKLEESLDRRYFVGMSPSSMAREHVKGSTRPPAAVVGP